MKLVHLIGATVLCCLLFTPLAATLAQGLAPAPSFAGTASGSLIGAIVKIVNWLLTLVGVVAALYLIYGGLKYITSAGDAGKADEAKATILYALIGLIVIGLSAVIVNFVLAAVVG